ncbi:MAG: hypothetical protein ACXADY_24305 [Candidatus Hodarchaeales archaeon]|jgi:hypothetical protein
MSEVQKELAKAKANEDAGNFDKAAQNYFKAAETTKDVKLYNKAFFISRKSGKTNLMYQLGKSYHDILDQEDQKDKIKELIPTFLEISGRERDRLAAESPEDMVDVLNWTTTLYQLVGKTEAAYDISLQTGDAYFSFGQQLLTTKGLIGKEEKWQRGLNLLDNAVEAFQQIRLDTQSLDRILSIKLDKISNLIDIGRHEEGIEDANSLMDYYRSQAADIVPYSDEVLSLKIAEIFAEKSLTYAQNKKFDIAEALMKTTKAGYENAGKYTLIAPYLWQLALIYAEFKQKELFFTLVDTTFDTSLKYEDESIQQTILNYLDGQAKEICENIISSRLLMVKKGPIEFQNNNGVHYLLKSMDLAKKINNDEIPEEALGFLYQYGQNMYAKKLTKHSLPYFEFCAQNFWTLQKESNRPREIINYLETKFETLITEGKFDDASRHLGSIISIKIFIEEAESAGDSAFSFAQAAGKQAKQKIELEFLERAYDAFTNVKAITKLQDMLNYIIQQTDPLFTLDSKTQEPREKFIHLGDLTAAAISEKAQGEFLQATTFKTLNTGLIELGIGFTEKTFEVLKNYDKQAATDLYFKVGSLLLETDMEKALEFISKSTKFAAEHEPLKDLVGRNLNYIQENALTSTDLSIKMFLAKKLELLCEIVEKDNLYNEFLFTFTKDLSEKAEQPDFFAEMKNFLSKTFYGFHTQDPNHSKISEIITWTNNHILEAYKDTQHAQMYELAIQDLAFHEELNQIQEYITFFWKLFDKFVSSEDFSNAISYFKQTYQTLIRMKQPKKFTEEFAAQAIASIDRGIKPKIADEKFDEAWPLIQGLFSILNKAGLPSQSVELYEANARLFAPHRLDLALTMWSQAIDTAKTIDDTKSITTIGSTIISDIVPVYVEKGIPQAVYQLFTQAITANEAIGNSASTLDVILQATRFGLSFGDFETLQKWGQKGFQLSSENQAEESLFEFANMFFAVGCGLLAENPEVGVTLIKTASDYLIAFKPSGFDFYCLKMAEIFEDLYISPSTQELAQKERAKILQHFKDSGKRKEEGSFLVTTAKLSFQAGNVNEGLDLITQATSILRELEDEDGLSEIVSVCYKTASNYRIGTDEYQALSRHAKAVQDTATVEISEEKTQEAFGDLFDGLLDDMTSLMDPKERGKREKEKKKKKKKR